MIYKQVPALRVPKLVTEAEKYPVEGSVSWGGEKKSVSPHTERCSTNRSAMGFAWIWQEVSKNQCVSSTTPGVKPHS